MIPNLNNIYQNLRQQNPNINEQLLRQHALIIRDKIYVSNISGKIKKIIDNDYIDDDYVESGYFQ